MATKPAADKPAADKPAAANEQEGQQFGIQRLYIKDLSLESPNVPQIFMGEWNPEMNMDLANNTQKLDDNTFEVTLKVTVTVKCADKTAFLVEVSQAGIFTIGGFSEEQIGPMLGSYCPNVLYPYAREVVTDAVIKAGFPQLYLSPVDFDALYAQHQQSGGDKEGDDNLQ